jgi:hypothetical protein
MKEKKPQKKRSSSALLHALDEAAFGSERTLNLRESLPSAAEARNRTEVWLRARQVTRVEEVLIITGRGNQSPGGVGVIRQEIIGMMPALRRRGIVESWREHSPGSIVVKLASVNALLSAPRRRRDQPMPGERPREVQSLAGLERETLRLLEDLASHNLRSLGVEDPMDFLQNEMARTFSALINALPAHEKTEENLRAAMRNALDETGS